jgi:transposase
VVFQLLVDDSKYKLEGSRVGLREMRKKYIVDLTAEERQYLEAFTTTGRHAAYQITRARILLKANVHQPDGGWGDAQISAALDVGTATVERVRRCFVELGLEASLKRQPGGGRKPKLNGEQEAHLIALRCSEPPKGQARWTLKLLADQMVTLGQVEAISDETVRQVLKKTNCNPGSKIAGSFHPNKMQSSSGGWKRS